MKKGSPPNPFPKTFNKKWHYEASPIMPFLTESPKRVQRGLFQKISTTARQLLHLRVSLTRIDSKSPCSTHGVGRCLYCYFISSDCLYCSASATSFHSTVLSKLFLTTCLISPSVTRKNSLLGLILFIFLLANALCSAASSFGASSVKIKACTSKLKGTEASPSSLILSIGSSLLVIPIL